MYSVKSRSNVPGRGRHWPADPPALESGGRDRSGHAVIAIEAIAGTIARCRRSRQGRAPPCYHAIGARGVANSQDRAAGRPRREALTPGHAEEGTMGWVVLGSNSQVLAVHAALLPTGEILYLSGDEHDVSQSAAHQIDHTRIFEGL